MTNKAAFPADRVKETTSTAGTGSYTLDNVVVPGYQRFSDWFSNGDRATILAFDGASTWELVTATYTSATHALSRDTVIWTSAASAAPINWVAGTKFIEVVLSAQNGNLAMQYHNITGLTGTGARDPTVTDDLTQGYDIGSFWLASPSSSGKGSFICVDATTGAAVWMRILTSLDKIYQAATMTTGGTTGAQTINHPSGSVNFAAAAASLVLTNSTITVNSIVICTVMTNDSTLKSVQAVVSAGSAALYANAAATAETKVGFLVIN